MAQLGQSNMKGPKSQYGSGMQNRNSWWSDHLPELFAGGVLLAFALVVVSCSKFGEKPAAVAMNQLAAPVSTPAMTPAAQPAVNPPAVPKKLKRKRPTTATYVNPEYGIAITYPRKYSLLVGDKAQLTWTGLGPVETNFVNSGGRTLAAVELPSDLFPDTDLASAFVNVSVKTGLTSAECAQFAFPQQSAAGTDKSAKQIIGANEFAEAREFNEQTAAQAEAKYYHVFQNGACYEFALGVGTAGDEGDVKVTQVDRQQVFDRLEKILATVKIQPAEVPATEGPVQTEAPAEKAAPSETPIPSSATRL
jgi:hypothetical protein